MPQAPDWFLKELKTFDPLLRIRWSDKMQVWHLERKLLAGLHPGTIRRDTEDDAYIRARDGYVHVCSMLPDRPFTRQIFAILRANDLHTHGWKRFADQADAFDQMREEKSWENFSKKVTDASKDVYELMKIRDGRTVFNAGWIQ